MKDLPITPADFLTFALIASIVFTITTGLGKWFLAYLNLKFGAKTSAQNIEAHTRAMAEQSQQCRFDHEGITKLVAAQNANIAKMLEQNGDQLREMAAVRSLAELHHERQMNAMGSAHEQLKRIEHLVGRSSG